MQAKWQDGTQWAVPCDLDTPPQPEWYCESDGSPFNRPIRKGEQFVWSAEKQQWVCRTPIAFGKPLFASESPTARILQELQLLPIMDKANLSTNLSIIQKQIDTLRKEAADETKKEETSARTEKHDCYPPRD